MMQDIADKRIVAIEVKTTGLRSTQDRVVELAAVCWQHGKITSTYQSLVNPGCSIREEATTVHGITDRLVADQPPIAEVLPDFLTFCKADLVIAHNAEFDIGFLRAECRRTGQSLFTSKVEDTLILARQFLPGCADYQLSALKEQFGFGAGNAQRALQDARDCLELFLYCMKLADDPTSPTRQSHVEDAAAELVADARQQRAHHTALAAPGVSVPAEMIGSLLAEAHLLRSRGQHEAAINLCSRIIHLDAHSAAAHSLLAQIYHEIGNDREALGFYRIAVELDPHNDVDKKALEATIDRVFRKSVTSETPSTPGKRSVAAGRTRQTAIRDIVKQFLLHLQPVPVVIGTTILALCVASFLLFHTPATTAHSGTPHDAVPSATAPNGEGVPTATTPAMAPPTSAEPRVTPPPPDAVEGGDAHALPGALAAPLKEDQTPTATAPAPANPPAGSTPTASAQVPPFQPLATGNMPGLDEMNARVAALRMALEQMLKKSKLPATLNDVRLDPRTNALTLDFSVPRMSGAGEAKQALLYTGFHLIWAAGEQNKSLASFTLRGAIALKEDEDPDLALIADVTPQQALSARSATDYQAVAGFLSNPWWRKELAAAAL